MLTTPKTTAKVKVRRHLLLAVAAASIALATSVSPAHAQDQAAGRALFDQAMSLYNAGKWAEACPKFEASFRQYPGIGTKGKLAECYEKTGRLGSAWRAYREASQLAMKGGDAVRSQIASERANSLEPRLARITLVVPQDCDVPGLVVKRSSVVVDRTAWGKAEPVDAGTVVFEFSAPRRVTAVVRKSIENGRSIEVEVPRLESDGEVAPKPAPVEPEPSTTEDKDHERETKEAVFTEQAPPSSASESTWQKPVGLAVAGVGVVGLAASGIFGLSANSKYDDAFHGGGCDSATNRCTPTGQRAVDDARSAATTSTIFAIAGGALVATGVVLYLTAPSSSSRTPTAAIRVVPTTYGTAGGGLTVAGLL